MNANGELYKKGELPAGMLLEPCPVCGADSELWLHSRDFANGPIDKLVMCSNGDRFGPQDGAMNEGCLLYMPPQEFYRARIIEAVKFWNQYSKALNAERRTRHWNRANVLRQGSCSLGRDLCNCGGDTPGVRAGCHNWKTSDREQSS
jgi:hypothetical protein